VDVLCNDDLDLYGRDLDDPMAELEQDVLHALLEPFGSNPDAPERGIGLEAALSGPHDPALAHRIETMLREDDRIADVEVTIAEEAERLSRIEIAITANEGELAMQFAPDPTGELVRVSS
jgi:phage baseplate assembly protein W